MHGIGTFRSSSNLTFASQTAAHDGMRSMQHLLAKVHPTLPKTGSLDSSQLVQLRSLPSRAAANKTQFGGAQNVVVKNALTRVRSAGTVSPKKAGVKRS